jgi:HAD superfamily hydrolase (TIGR01509 family)
MSSVNKILSPKSKIKCIIFDLGGVVIDPCEGQNKFISETMKIPIDIVNATFKERVRILLKGELNENDFWKKYAESHMGNLPEDWNTLWSSFYLRQTPVKKDVLTLINDLKKAGYFMPLLSDTILSHDKVNQSRKIYDVFSNLYLSFKTHSIKSEKKAFQNVLDNIPYKAHECIFIDDLIENVNLAKQLDIQGLHFTYLDKLKNDLCGLGVQLNQMLS